LALCGAAALIGAPGATRALEFEGGDSIDAKSLLAQLHSLAQDPKAHFPRNAAVRDPRATGLRSPGTLNQRIVRSRTAPTNK